MQPQVQPSTRKAALEKNLEDLEWKMYDNVCCIHAGMKLHIQSQKAQVLHHLLCQMGTNLE